MIATLPHAEWQATQEEADSFADGLAALIDSALATMPTAKRLIYCQHLAQLGGRYSFELQAADHDAEINSDTGHRNDCGCESCIEALDLAF